MTLARLATLLAAAAAAAAPRALAAAPARGLLQDGAACQQGGGTGACEANPAYYVENSGWFDALDAAYDRFRECTDFREETGCRSGQPSHCQAREAQSDNGAISICVPSDAQTNPGTLRAYTDFRQATEQSPEDRARAFSAGECPAPAYFDRSRSQDCETTYTGLIKVLACGDCVRIFTTYAEQVVPACDGASDCAAAADAAQGFIDDVAAATRGGGGDDDDGNGGLIGGVVAAVVAVIVVAAIVACIVYRKKCRNRGGSGAAACPPGGQVPTAAYGQPPHPGQQWGGGASNASGQQWPGAPPPPPPGAAGSADGGQGPRYISPEPYATASQFLPNGSAVDGSQFGGDYQGAVPPHPQYPNSMGSGPHEAGMQQPQNGAGIYGAPGWAPSGHHHAHAPGPYGPGSQYAASSHGGQPMAMAPPPPPGSFHAPQGHGGYAGPPPGHAPPPGYGGGPMPPHPGYAGSPMQQPPMQQPPMQQAPMYQGHQGGYADRGAPPQGFASGPTPVYAGAPPPPPPHAGGPPPAHGQAAAQFAQAPANQIKVAWTGGPREQAVTTMTQLEPAFEAHTRGSSGGQSTLSTDASAASMLDAQLDYLSEAREGMLTPRVRLVGRHGRRMRANGAVAFAHDVAAESRELAVKFFFTDAAFERELAMTRVEVIASVMPPVVSAEAGPEARSTATYPSPLNTRPLPPMLTCEKGESLEDFASRRAPDFFVAIQILVHIARKLDSLHRAGWVHRDLKPPNTIWLPSKNEWTLVDFAAAGERGRPCELSFSLYYAPPEVMAAYNGGAGSIVAEPSADIWALGVMTFELLSKTKFYGEGATMQSVVAALGGDAPFITESPLTPELRASLGSRAFRNSVLSMLSRDPHERPSAADVVRDWTNVFQATQT